MEWKSLFPESVPPNVRVSSDILVGGFYLNGKWKQVVATYRPFSADVDDSDFHEECRVSKSRLHHWVVDGFITLNNFSTVNWQYWAFLPPPPYK